MEKADEGAPLARGSPTEELTALWQRVVKHYGLTHGCQKVETSIPLYREDGSLEGYRGADMYAIAADGDLPYLVDDVGEPLADFIVAAIRLTGWRVHPPRYAYPAGRQGNAAPKATPSGTSNHSQEGRE